ncbi:hypothetical protein CB0940_10956 [Cercospora beticola]|uniref:Uncharacterized protein n=1 Tax=Cercospora beticola TaxID=122368 RepID=A0A2G5HCV3_CERBT|nr:hypothetical protein CB0940_10956 [Cercospora beticola]PIA90377.1 hypothetical protein CB0940_10956 [Cercospora beticola]WPB07695.1 hypothetical protein RHO25_012356 [Cercospora beticola]
MEKEESCCLAPAYGYDNYTAAPSKQYIQPPMPAAQYPAFMQYMPTSGPALYVYNPQPYHDLQPKQFGGQYMRPPAPQGWPHPPPPQAFGTAYAGNPLTASSPGRCLSEQFAAGSTWPGRQLRCRG